MRADFETVQLFNQFEELAVREWGRFLYLLWVSFLELFPELDLEGREWAAQIFWLGGWSKEAPLLGGAVAYAVVGCNPL